MRSKMINNTKTNETSIILTNGRSVHPEFLNYVLDAVTTRLPELSHHSSFPLKQIFGETLWSYLDRGERIKAGSCMVHLVSTGRVPLIVVEKRHEYPIYYQIK